MRAQPRPDVERRASARPTPPPLAPPVQSPAGLGGHRRPERRRRRFRVRYVFVLLLLWLVYLVVVPIMAWNKVDKVDVRARPATGPPTSPGRRTSWSAATPAAGLSKEDRKELHTGNAGGGRTDTIMLMHTGSGPNLLMSIPRDLEVDIPGHGSGKINAAYAYRAGPAAREDDRET